VEAIAREEGDEEDREEVNRSVCDYDRVTF
jgi:hypothetical protein